MDHNVYADRREQGSGLPGVDTDLGGVVQVVLGLGQFENSLFHNFNVSDVNPLGSFVQLFHARKTAGPVHVTLPSVTPQSLQLLEIRDGHIRHIGKGGAAVVHCFQCAPVSVVEVEEAVPYGIRNGY